MSPLIGPLAATARGDLIRTAIFLSDWLERPDLEEMRLIVD
jgi:hypothetical protein